MTAFESFSTDLCTLINRHLSSDGETIVGWCLLVDKECQMLKVARIFFDRFLRALVRCLVANVPVAHCTLGEEMIDALAEEIVDLVRPLVGLVVLREWGQTHLTTEYCGYQCKLTREDCLALLAETALDNVVDGSPIDDRSLPHLSELDPIAILAIAGDIGGVNNDASSLVEPEGDPLLALASQKPKRMTKRKRQSSISSETSLLSPRPALRQRGLNQALPDTFSVLPCDVELIDDIQVGAGVLPNRGQKASVPLSAAEQETLRSSIAMKEAKVDLLLSNLETIIGEERVGRSDVLEGYLRQCSEYELLTTIYKIISQPDEVVLKKIADLENYEERMRKLGTRLKNALTPEDLLKTLASIKTPISPSDRI